MTVVEAQSTRKKSSSKKSTSSAASKDNDDDDDDDEGLTFTKKTTTTKKKKTAADDGATNATAKSRRSMASASSKKMASTTDSGAALKPVKRPASSKTLPNRGSASSSSGGKPSPARRGVAPTPAKKPASNRNMAPSRPKSMRDLPGEPPLPSRQRPSKPQSMRTSGHRPLSMRKNGDATNQRPTSSRQLGPGRGGMRGMGKNAISNRNLPPPPKSRSIFSSSSHHKMPSSRHMQSKRSLIDSDDDDDDDDSDEFATDKADVVPTKSSSSNNKNNSSILRKSVLHGSRGTSSRTNADGSISMSAHSANFSLDEDEETDVEKVPIVSRMPSKSRPTLKRPGLTMDHSDHSMRGWTQSFRWGSKESSGGRNGAVSDYSTSRSVRSLLTVDAAFENEPIWKQLLRFIRILAPHPNEKPIKKRIRIAAWASLVLDFLAALVSIFDFEDVSYCCGEPILSIAGKNVNWAKVTKITVYLYMVAIFAEVIPVMRKKFPFNLANPLVGFLITFAVFFDDQILEAVIMWIIEAMSVVCECYGHLLKVRWYKQRQERLDKTEANLVAIRKERRRRIMGNSTHSSGSISSDLSFDDSSFHDESNMSSEGESLRRKDVSQLRETRLLRERRLLRQAQINERKHLKIHFIGVAFNVGLVGITLLLIIMIGRGGGLCIVDMTTPNIFKVDQLERCYDCKGSNGPCESCDRPDGGSHCYYPYY